MNTTDSRPDHDSNTLLGLGSSAVLGVSASDEELFGDACPGERGNTRAPKFGEWMRGVWASKRNPHRDGMFVRTVRRTGRMNPGTWHELTDGEGNFWQYEARSTVFLTPNVGAKLETTAPARN